MKKQYYFLATLLVLLSANLYGQLTIEGQLRTMGEYRDGYKTLPTDNTEPLLMVGQRSRLIFNYKKDALETRFSIQDARIWGEDKWKTDNMGIGLKEAWAKYSFNKNISFKVGRQELVYDDGRLFASGDWRTYGESHDAALLIIKSTENNFTGHIGYSVSNNTSAETAAFASPYELASSQYKNMAYIWLNQKLLDKKLNISLIAVRDGHQYADSLAIEYRNTYGGYFSYAPSDISIEGAFYQQDGKATDGKDINAQFYSAKLSYKLMKSGNVWVAYDHYSGSDLNDAGYSTESNTFNNLYGPGHKYLGYMDYFGIPGKHKAGVNDINIGLQLKLPKKFSLMAKYHMFSLDKEYIKKETIIKVDPYLGSEIDLIVAKKFTDQVIIKAGYSFMSPTSSMETLKLGEGIESNFPQFAWLMINITPKFYDSAKK